MKKREKQTETYLDNGIAIPHGVREDSHLVKKTGVVILQCAKAIDWGKNKVRIIAAIAANNDEHIPILQKLTHIVLSPSLAQKLSQTSRPEDFLEVFVKDSTEEIPQDISELLRDFSFRGESLIPSTEALHARPATLFSRLAKKFSSTIRIATPQGDADAKSTPQILRLGAQKGTRIVIGARGEDAKEALNTLTDFLAHDYYLSSTSTEESSGRLQASSMQEGAHYEGKTIVGKVVYDGVIQEKVYVIKPGKRLNVQKRKRPEEEWKKIDDAFGAVITEITNLVGEIKEQDSLGEIFESHVDILEDMELRSSVKKRIIDYSESATSAWEAVMTEHKKVFLEMDDPLFRERSADFDDLFLRVSEKMGNYSPPTPMPTEPCILICRDLLPSQAVKLDVKTTQGLVVLNGGPTSHAAIIARSKTIPTLMGLSKENYTLLEQQEGKVVILDTLSSCIVVDPSEGDTKQALKRKESHLSFVTTALSRAQKEAITKDGVKISIQANMGSVTDSENFDTSGAEGVGLFRSEFLFLDRSTAPDVEEQRKIYQLLSEKTKNDSLVIRSIDIGGDKMIPYISLPPEDNPFLGVRGIRLCFRYPKLFEDQLRAIFQANSAGNISIMFPMIGRVDEFKRAREIVEKIHAQEGGPACPVGIMIEIPSVLFELQDFVSICDFFSIGTNDLIQYLFASGRGNAAPELAIADYHPAILRTLYRIVQKVEGKPLSICGAMGGNKKMTALLIGLGFRKLSMMTSLVSLIKETVRSLSSDNCKDLAQQAIQCTSVQEVENLMGEWKF